MTRTLSLLLATVAALGLDASAFAQAPSGQGSGEDTRAPRVQGESFQAPAAPSAGTSIAEKEPANTEYKPRRPRRPRSRPRWR